MLGPRLRSDPLKTIYATRPLDARGRPSRVMPGSQPVRRLTWRSASAPSVGC